LHLVTWIALLKTFDPWLWSFHVIRSKHLVPLSVTNVTRDASSRTIRSMVCSHYDSSMPMHLLSIIITRWCNGEIVLRKVNAYSGGGAV
jgi:hypothetical protein